MRVAVIGACSIQCDGGLDDLLPLGIERSIGLRRIIGTVRDQQSRSGCIFRPAKEVMIFPSICIIVQRKGRTSRHYLILHRSRSLSSVLIEGHGH